jgi:hypothetical protein
MTPGFIAAVRSVCRSQHIAELHFIYLSGARCTNEDFIKPTEYMGHAGNPPTARSPFPICQRLADKFPDARKRAMTR